MSTGTDEDDRLLVSRFLRTRDESSFRALYRRHTPALYAFSLRLLEHRAVDAEDAVQDMWIRAIERLGGFRWESSLRTWLAGIAVNCCRERSRTGWRWVQPDDLVLDRPDDEAPLDLTMAVDRSMATLPAGCRAVFVLHDVEGYTHEEIGVILGIAPGTSKSQLFHARRRLRALLQ